jgi:hypothetical protein
MRGVRHGTANVGRSEALIRCPACNFLGIEERVEAIIRNESGDDDATGKGSSVIRHDEICGPGDSVTKVASRAAEVAYKLRIMPW